MLAHIMYLPCDSSAQVGSMDSSIMDEKQNPHEAKTNNDTDECSETAVVVPAGIADNALQLLFGEMPIKERFGDLTGCLMLQKIFQHYQVADKVTVPFFTTDGQRAIIRHGKNNRVQHSVVQTYASGICRSGIVPGVRGEAWFQWGPDRTYPVKAITFGTLTDAAYLCFEKYPDQFYVKATKSAGIPQVRLLHENMPESVAEWMVQYHNNFHHGSSYSFLELLQDIPSIEQGWSSHKTQLGITAKSLGGTNQHDQAYDSWLKEHHGGKIRNFEVFTKGKSAVHTLEKFGLLDNVKRYCGENCNFLEPTLRTDFVIFAIHGMSTLMASRFSKSWPKEYLQIAMMEAVKLAVPS